MKIRVAPRSLFAALLLSSPLVAQAQTTPTHQRPTTPANASRSVDRLTLLRGPELLSPATTAAPDDARTRAVQEKVLDAQRRAREAGLLARKARAERDVENALEAVENAADADLARQRLLEARLQLQSVRKEYLEAERAAALERQKEYEAAKKRMREQEADSRPMEDALRDTPKQPPSPDTIRFDSRLAPMPTQLVPKDQSATGTIKFVPAEKK